MRRIRVIGITSVVVFSAMALFGCGLFSELKTISDPHRDISGTTNIGIEWVELVPPEPLFVTAKRHKVSIRTDAVKTFDERDPTNQTLRFVSGGTGRIEAVLYDNRGQEYELKVVGIGGSGGGVYLGRVRAAGLQNARNEQDFPAGLSFVKLKIRSDVPFDAKSIEWISEVQK